MFSDADRLNSNLTLHLSQWAQEGTWPPPTAAGRHTCPAATARAPPGTPKSLCLSSWLRSRGGAPPRHLLLPRPAHEHADLWSPGRVPGLASSTWSSIRGGLSLQVELTKAFFYCPSGQTHWLPTWQRAPQSEAPVHTGLKDGASSCFNLPHSNPGRNVLFELLSQ